MNQICDVMTRDVRVVTPDDLLLDAAQRMQSMNIGALPVCDGDRLVGMVTDRDIVVRAVALARPAVSTPVGDVMTTPPRWCYDDQDIDDVLDEMRDAQVRRLPVLDREQRLVGIVSLGDLADRGASGPRIGEALRDISSPSEPLRQ